MARATLEAWHVYFSEGQSARNACSFLEFVISKIDPRRPKAELLCQVRVDLAVFAEKFDPTANCFVESALVAGLKLAPTNRRMLKVLTSRAGRSIKSMQ